MPYITPAETPESTACRALLIPDSTDWLAIFGGALTELIYEYNWEQVEGMSVGEAVQVAMQVVNGFYEGCAESGCTLPDGSAILRVNGEGKIEQLVNGDWVDPIGDYAIPPVPPREESTPDERKCLAAANAAYVLQQLYEEATDAASEGASNAEVLIQLIAVAVLIIAPWLGLAIEALVALIAGLFFAFVAIARTMTSDLWTTEFTDLLRCYLYECALDNDDVVTFDYQCLREKIATYADVLDPDFLNHAKLFGQIDFILSIIGIDGVNAGGATTEVETADCDDCEQYWCYARDFTLDNGAADGWYIPLGAGSVFGDWALGTGFFNVVSSGSNQIYIENDTPMPSLTYFNMTYTKSTDGSGANNRNELQVYDAGGVIAINNADITSPEPRTKELEGNWADVTTIVANINAGTDTGCSISILSVRLQGKGENPFGEDNC